MNTITVVILILLAFLGTCIVAIALLRKRPGLRRRREDPNYDGPPRRMTDCSVDLSKAFEAVNSETEIDDGVKMQNSPHTKGNK